MIAIGAVAVCVATFDKVIANVRRLWLKGSTLWKTWWCTYHTLWCVMTQASYWKHRKLFEVEGETRGQWVKRRVLFWKKTKSPGQKIAELRAEGRHVEIKWW